MKISKDLIERYHRQECTEEEAEAVEAWLFSSDTDEALQLPLGMDKGEHKSAIWSEISKTLPNETESVAQKSSAFISPFWSGAVAASLIAGIIGLAGYQFMNSPKAPVRQFVMVNNTSSINVRPVESSGYNISIGTNTSARIDNLTGVVDLTGSMLICPKKDIELSFEGSSEKMMFKGGQTYIILKGKDGKDKVIIVSEKNIMDLPPVIQKQIINEFNI